MKVSPIHSAAFVFLVGAVAAAFSHGHDSSRHASPRLWLTRNKNKITLQLGGANNGNDETSTNPALELTTALARLDRQFQIQQKVKKSKSRWTELYLPKEEDEEKEEGVSATSSFFDMDQLKQKEQDLVYLLEPPNDMVPSCLIVFWGGAGLGQFPHVAYNELLVRISDRLNAAILTAPYQVGLDHFDLAKRVGELSRRAVIQCEDDPTRLYPPHLPTYCLTHSLGGKLSVIYMAATGQEYNGVGLMSFNNFGFSDTLRMAREFARQIQGQMSGGRGGDVEDGGDAGDENPRNDIWNQIFTVAETIVGTVGIDFSPTSFDMNRLIELKYDQERQSKTRLFQFDDDTLDNTQDFVRACVGDDDKRPLVSLLSGTHLTPVYFKLGLDELPDDAREMARDAMGGIQSASFGNEEEMNALVDEVCGWILGRGPSRVIDFPRLTGTSSTDAEGQGSGI